MDWTREDVFALASPRCRNCKGRGWRAGNEPCQCALKAIFHACYSRLIECSSCERVSPDVAATMDHGLWSRKDAEFAADFIAIARRALRPSDVRLFELHFLQGANAHVIGRRLGQDPHQIRWSLHRIRITLGRAFRETRPYPLFPLDEYFSTGRHVTKPLVMAAAA